MSERNPSLAEQDGDPDFEARLLPGLRRIPFFRLATPIEIGRSYAAYREARSDRRSDGSSDGNSSDRSTVADRLIAVWTEVANPTRAELGPYLGRIYRRSGALPKLVTGLTFLYTIRAVLSAGKLFQARLRSETRRAIDEEFPWLKDRHLHVPAGYAPELVFPDEFVAFIDAQSGSLDDARVRWQVVAAFNEVQQSVCSRHLGELFGVPELRRHADVEAELARRYFRAWSPRVTERLWAQCIHVLDGLNAAVYEMLCRRSAAQVMARSVLGAVSASGRDEWRAFAKGLPPK